jgi:4-amino-4-deoxy-L-arabinose transferase-like glycosyltransferase
MNGSIQPRPVMRFVLPPGVVTETGSRLIDLASPGNLKSRPDTASELRSPEPNRGRLSRAVARAPWPLLLVLAVQAWLSLRLLHLDTAFADEALYLWVGHQDWAHLLHGTPLPPFATYLSGSPAVYPPVAAIADSIGGLTGARVLSLCFMLGATTLLWSTAARLYGRRAAFLATAVWGLLGETVRLGAFATYDSMACFLLTLAAWCAVRAALSSSGAGWAIGAAAALATANSAKYATAIFDPTVIALAALTALTCAHSRKEAIRLGVITASYTAICLIGLLAVATARNQYYVTGLLATTLGRPAGGDSTATILSTFWPYMKVLGPVAAVTGLACLRLERGPYRRLLILMLLATGLVAPLNQLRIHTSTSLAKHEDFAAWFVALALGYGLAAVMRGGRVRQAVAFLAALAVIGASAVIGWPTAVVGDDYWPDTTQVVAVMRPLLARTGGEVLFQNASILDYYIGPAYHWDAIWERISGQGSLRLPSGRTVDDASVGSAGVPAPYIAAVRAGYFKLIVLNNDGTDTFDAALIPAIAHDRAYRLIARPGVFLVWEYAPQPRHSRHPRRHR